MKKLLLLLIILLSALTADAQLTIYSITGDLERLTSTGWVGVSRFDKLTPLTKLRASDGTQFQILDRTTGRLFTSAISGIATVAYLMDLADKNAKSIISNTNRSILAAADSRTSSKKRFRSGGLAYHTTDAANSDSMSLKELFEIENYSDQTDVVLIRRELTDDDGTFYFAVFNTLDYPVYFNIVSSPTSPIKFMLPINAVAAPRQETILPEFKYVKNGASSYALISSMTDFNSIDVENLIYCSLPEFHLSILHCGK